jgi:hypothetical protein
MATQGDRMNAFCRSFPASCYSEIVSHLSISSGYCDAFWAESSLEVRTTPKAQKAAFPRFFCSVLRTFWPLFHRFQRLFMTASKTHPTHNKWLRYVSLLENTYPPTPPSTVKLWNCDGIDLHSCDCPGWRPNTRQHIQRSMNIQKWITSCRTCQCGRESCR